MMKRMWKEKLELLVVMVLVAGGQPRQSRSQRRTAAGILLAIPREDDRPRGSSRVYVQWSRHTEAEWNVDSEGWEEGVDRL